MKCTIMQVILHGARHNWINDNTSFLWCWGWAPSRSSFSSLSHKASSCCWLASSFSNLSRWARSSCWRLTASASSFWCFRIRSATSFWWFSTISVSSFWSFNFSAWADFWRSTQTLLTVLSCLTTQEKLKLRSEMSLRAERIYTIHRWHPIGGNKEVMFQYLYFQQVHHCY